MILGAMVTHRRKHGGRVLWWRPLCDAVAKVEHMAMAIAIAGEDAGDFFLDGFR